MSTQETPEAGSPDPSERYFRSGLGLRQEVRGTVEADYRSEIVQRLRRGDFEVREGDVTVLVAREFGFCYGVERAIDYAYEALTRFPDRLTVLIGEIIHNPEVNRRLRAAGIRFLGDPEVPDLAAVRPDHVVLLPAFGVPATTFGALRESGAIIVDTTCGSVLNVWKNVERYAREGRTAIVHGKASHEETLATISRVGLTEGAHYLVVLDMDEAKLVADFVRGESRDATWGRDAFLARFGDKSSAGFDPARHLERVGMANQTTMLSVESLAIAATIRTAYEERYGAEDLSERFRSFDTICSATQDRQDALRDLLEEPLDVLIVIGGYNSSNTGHLLELAEGKVPAYHVEGPESLVSCEVIRHRPIGGPGEIETHVDGDWLPSGTVRIGLTAGASTPEVVIGAIVDRVLDLHRSRAR